MIKIRKSIVYPKPWYRKFQRAWHMERIGKVSVYFGIFFFGHFTLLNLKKNGSSFDIQISLLLFYVTVCIWDGKVKHKP